MKTDIRIINGHQIGGCITVISTDTTKIVIDFGEALPGSEITEQIEFDWQSENVDAVFFTHYHGDHIGRFAEIPKNIPLYMGEVTYRVMKNIRHYIRDTECEKLLETRGNINFIQSSKKITVGDIEVTPYWIDHSAFDAYMFLIKANGEYILHTGDYRDHGHRGQVRGRNVTLDVINKFVRNGGRRNIDCLITEGTMMTRLNEKPCSEKQMMRDAEEFFRENRYVFLKISSTNVDSLASFANAAKKNGMKMLVNRYVMEQINLYKESGGKYTSMYAFDNVYPLMSHPDKCTSDKQKKTAIAQREAMRRTGFVILVDGHFDELYEEFSDLPVKCIYSMWSGYLNPKSKAFDKELYNFYNKTNAITMHTSGHASPELIKQVIEAVNPTQAIIPIHTEVVDEFYNLGLSEELKEKIVK